MSRSSDPALRAAWQRRLRAFAAYRGTVRQFCAEQGVSEATFYHWRRKLARQPSPAEPSNPAAADGPPSPRFVPLKLAAGPSPETGRGTASIELAGGTRIELPGADLELVQAVLESVMQHDRSLASQQGTSFDDQKPEAAAARPGGAR